MQMSFQSREYSADGTLGVLSPGGSVKLGSSLQSWDSCPSWDHRSHLNELKPNLESRKQLPALDVQLA